MKPIIFAACGLLLANSGLAAPATHSAHAYAQKGAARPKEGAASSAPTPVPPELGVRGPSVPFPDVPKDHWAYTSVEAVRKAGIVVGYPSGADTGR